MKVRHLDHINMTVRDFDQTVDWYGRVFDFELVEEALTDGVRWGVIRSGEALLCIYEDPNREHLDRFELKDRGLHRGPDRLRDRGGVVGWGSGYVRTHALTPQFRLRRPLYLTMSKGGDVSRPYTRWD
jgi:catechol 2,3-dioxygenase-like lactoylglutathione lyase family enzyme